LWALCAGELATTVLINAPGGQTLPVPIFNLMHIGSTAEVAALSLTLFALSGLASTVAAAAFFVRRKSHF
jgi:iron(III) transport system permease protein